MIRVIDLARAIADAGAAPVRSGATVASIDLEIAMLAGAPPTADTLWTMQLRYPDPPRLRWLAAWRRSQRRRAGVDVARILFRWTPSYLDAVVGGQVVARLDLTASGGTVP